MEEGEKGEEDGDTRGVERRWGRKEVHGGGRKQEKEGIARGRGREWGWIKKRKLGQGWDINEESKKRAGMGAMQKGKGKRKERHQVHGRAWEMGKGRRWGMEGT